MIGGLGSAVSEAVARAGLGVAVSTVGLQDVFAESGSREFLFEKYGLSVQAIVNAAWSRGLGCVINSQGIMQSPVVRAEAGIPDDQVIQTCIAMGWPDDSFPANAVVSERKSVDEAVVFRGFED